MSAGVAANRSLKKIGQWTSHANLHRKVPRLHPQRLGFRRTRLDAVIVPASSTASSLQPTIDLAAATDVPLVVLCSKRTKAAQVAQRVLNTPRARALIIPVPDAWTHPAIPRRTSSAAFKRASAHRLSDLSAKRNLGLLLARLRGWNKIAFVDDDIRFLGNRDMTQLAGQLDEYRVAGMVVPRFPDNSVVCHARRLAGQAQDVFVTGAVLGVHCNSLPPSFFPDIYNEDWFFFAEEAAARRLPCVGKAMQTEYDPFATPDRARREEFGDLLAEGLYALMGQRNSSLPFDDHVRSATGEYWRRFIEARHEAITETMAMLRDLVNRDSDNHTLSSALISLAAAENQLTRITPDLCVSFLREWRDDVRDWQKFLNDLTNVGSIREAMDFLELKIWTLVEFGTVVESETTLVVSRVD
jgi:hypothetical protein